MRKTVFRPVDTLLNADVKAEWTSFGREPKYAYRTPLAWSLEKKMDNQLEGNCRTAVAGVKPL